jgi:hypothetical protein
VKCDVCGGALARLADALVRRRVDDDGVVAELVMVHGVGCAHACDATAHDCTFKPAAAFTESTSDAVTELRASARRPTGASVTRLLRRVQRLAGLEAKAGPEAQDGRFWPSAGARP